MDPPIISRKSSMKKSMLHRLIVVIALLCMVQEALGQQCPSNDLTVCLPAAEADVQPTEECCANLQAYASAASPEVCLCEAGLSSTFVDDENLNIFFALQIPLKCDLQFPAGTACAGFVIPGGQ